MAGFQPTLYGRFWVTPEGGKESLRFSGAVGSQPWLVSGMLLDKVLV